ncbi:hypothetical protein Lal_00019482 [Lupinus albus]|nr:hypothetical protein Lal_00019482 [Lupinus albus]
MISARAAGRTTIVSPVTTRVELSQKVWYSCLSESERASGISWRILGEAVSGDSPAESRMRGDLHVRFGGRGYPDPTIIMPLQFFIIISQVNNNKNRTRGAKSQDGLVSKRPVISSKQLLDRARDAHSLKFKSGLSPLQHFYYFLASPFQRSPSSLPRFSSILSPPSSSSCSILINERRQKVQNSQAGKGKCFPDSIKESHLSSNRTGSLKSVACPSRALPIA